jgi:hypothetical protein
MWHTQLAHGRPKCLALEIEEVILEIRLFLSYFSSHYVSSMCCWKSSQECNAYWSCRYKRSLRSRTHSEQKHLARRCWYGYLPNTRASKTVSISPQLVDNLNLLQKFSFWKIIGRLPDSTMKSVDGALWRPWKYACTY